MPKKPSTKKTSARPPASPAVKCNESAANKRGFFTRVAEAASYGAGTPVAFATAVIVVFLWALTGPIFGFSDTWQIVINTATTIITFLLVFLIQHSQNRDTRAMHVKLDELIRVTQGAHNALINLEKLSEEELREIFQQYDKLAKRAREEMRKGRTDTGIIDLESIPAKPPVEKSAKGS